MHVCTAFQHASTAIAAMCNFEQAPLKMHVLGFSHPGLHTELLLSSDVSLGQAEQREAGQACTSGDVLICEVF